MLKATTRGTLATRGLALTALLTGAAAAPAAAQTAYGLLANPFTSATSLVTFQVTAPATFTNPVAITGLATGQTLVGIDTRPATGELFALGYAASGTQAQLYTLNITTGALTAIGTPQTVNVGSELRRIGFDFNPTVDRIRVTGSNGGNFRLNPNNGAIAATDGNLAYAAAPEPNAGQTPSVGSSAYTNSYIGSTATTLYNIDDNASRLVTQNPPNAGTLNTVGALGVSVSDATFQASDLDIYFNPTTSQNVAYLSVSTASLTAGSITSQLYTVNLATGATTLVGQLGTAGTTGISDIAVAINRTVPATVTGQLAYGLAGTNLITFDTALPGTVRTSVGITGVDATQTIVGMDVRPANNALYALGYNAAATGTTANSQLYTINAVTGVASPLGAAVRLELGTGNVGFDFNPTVDRIRVVSASTRNNYRLNPTFGAANVLAATDGQVAYTSGTNIATIGAVAYINSFAGTTATTLYNYDQALNVLNTQATANPPADGQLTTVGSSGITVNTTTPLVDLDIYSPSAGNNSAYLVANPGTAANTSFYTVNLATGAATLVGNGTIGNGIAVRNIAIAAATGVVTSSRAAELATELSLYPNPLADAARVSFGLPRAARVELRVTDVLGRTVDVVDAGLLPAGPQTVRWQRGRQAAGLYFFTLRFDGQVAGTRQAAITE